MPLYEDFRPQTFADVVGQDKVLATLDGLRERGGLGGRAYWITGASGTGKTTIARLIAAELADPWSIEECDASELSPARIKELERSAASQGLMPPHGRAIIVNEAHGLTKPAVRQLLTTLERPGRPIPRHAAWLFTTTCDGEDIMLDGTEDAHPLLSRCVRLPLARRNLTDAFAARLQTVAEAAGLGGKPSHSYKRLLMDRRNNFRAALQDVEAGLMKG